MKDQGVRFQVSGYRELPMAANSMFRQPRQRLATATNTEA